MLPEHLAIPIDTRRLRSFDGTEITYHVTAAPSPEPAAHGPAAPWVVLANGLGGSPLVWRGQIDYLRDRYRFVTWDYRGLHDSERPRPERADAYSVPNHVRDLEAILAAEGIDHAAFVGWSTGVQVVLEAFARLRGVARALVLLNGAWGRPLDALTPVRSVRALLLPFLELFRRAKAIGPGAHRPIGRAEAARWLRRLGLVGRSADEAALAELTSSVGRLDLDAFFRNLRAFGEHDAREVLTGIDVPTLVITGDRDPVVPRSLAQQMARRIPQAELLVVRGGAHCTPVEYPELIALRLERFFREHGI